MKRGKKPPIAMKLVLTRGERMHKAVFRTKIRPSLDSASRSWIEINCQQCVHRNVERMVEDVLLGEQEMLWKHICCHPGPVKLIAITSREQGIHNCSGFKENSPETPLEKS